MALLFTVIWFLPCAQKDHSCSSSTWWPTWKTHLIGCLRGYTVSCGHMKCLRLQQTQGLLQNFRWATLDYQLYSPDLAPSHFHLSLALKEHLSGHCFNCNEDIKCATITWLTTTGIYVLTHPRRTVLLHTAKSVSSIKGTMFKNGSPVTTSLYIVTVPVKILPLIYVNCKLTFWSTFTLTDQHDRTFHNIWIFLFWLFSVCSPSSAATVQTVWRCLNCHIIDSMEMHQCHITGSAEAYMYQCVTL